MNASVIVAVILGGILGFLADRLSARWPVHPDGTVRAIDWRTPSVTIAGAAAFGALADRWTEPRDLAVVGIYAAVLIVLLATDLDQKLLPDLLTLPLIGYAVVTLLLGWNPLLAGKDLAWFSAIAAGLGAPALLLVTDRLFGGALGMGDVKLAAGLGLFAGITRLVGGFLVASIVAAVVLLALIALKRLSLRSAIPFGPVLVAAGLLAAILGG
ncbi:MAG: A24 family peptidase [Chloroflexota bacterium]